MTWTQKGHLHIEHFFVDDTSPHNSALTVTSLLYTLPISLYSCRTKLSLLYLRCPKRFEARDLHNFLS